MAYFTTFKAFERNLTSVLSMTFLDFLYKFGFFKFKLIRTILAVIIFASFGLLGGLKIYLKVRLLIDPV